ncbi:hypothetical protein YC2023_051609 [Brassica napus]
MANDIILSRVDMDVKKSEALASSASSEGRAYKKCPASPIRQTFESLRLGRSSQSTASGFLASGIP